MSTPISSVRPKPDQVLVDIADYVSGYRIESPEACATARLCLMDTLGCGLEALGYPECTKLLGPIVPGTIVPHGAKVPGTSFQLDPVQAAFSIGTMIRWLDFNDTWLAAEWGHPSDNLGGILAVADWLSRTAAAQGRPPLRIRDVLTAMIQAHEIQGVIALENSFNRVGLDHVLLVKVATTAVVSRLLGLSRDEIINALSLAWVDGQALRTYRHAPNTGSRKSWAAGDATSRGVRLALMARTGEMGYPSVLTAKTWGFYDVLFRGQPFQFPRAYGSYVMEHVLFKISFPAEFHAQTAAECAMRLHPLVKDRLGEIRKITIRTHESAIRIIDKKGPLSNPADRDHCIQYMVAVPLIFGRLTAADYEDAVAADPSIDELRPHGVRRGSPVHPRLSRPGKTLDRQRHHDRVPRREEDGRGGGRVSDRPPSAAQGGHPLAGSEVRHQPGPPLPAATTACDPGGLRGRAEAGGDGGERVCGPVRDLNQRA